MNFIGLIVYSPKNAISVDPKLVMNLTQIHLIVTARKKIIGLNSQNGGVGVVHDLNMRLSHPRWVH